MDSFVQKSERAIKIFRQLDKNGDGKITEEDFVLTVREMGLGKVGETIAKRLFREIDSNKNGKLDLNEAVELFDRTTRLVNRKNKDENSTHD